MKGKITCFLVYCLLYSSVIPPRLHAQSIDAVLMDARSCEDIEKAIYVALPTYYSQNMIDSIGLLLEIIEQGCPLSPTLRFTKTMYALETGTAPDNEWLDPGVITFYKSAIRQVRGYGRNTLMGTLGNDVGFLDFTGQQYLIFLQKWAVNLATSSTVDDGMKDLLLHFTNRGKNIHRVFNKSNLRNTTMGKQYHAYHARTTLGRAWTLEMGWHQKNPVDDSLQVLMGSRSTIAINFGWIRGKGKITMNTRLDATRRPQQDFFVSRPDTSFFSNYLQSSATSFTYGHTLFRVGSRLYLYGEGGIGWERRYYVKKFSYTEDEETIPWKKAIYDKMGPHSVSNFLWRAGIDARYFFTPVVALSGQLYYEHISRKEVPRYLQGSALLGGLQLAYYIRSRAPEGKGKLKQRVFGE